MITATELLDFITKAQGVSSSEVTFIQVDGGYYITLYGDWNDDNNYSRKDIYISNKGESSWEKGDYDFETMSTILDEMVERQKQEEIKERKRRELIARLTDEEKELLNLM
jgi:hypothetical protein